MYGSRVRIASPRPRTSQSGRRREETVAASGGAALTAMPEPEPYDAQEVGDDLAPGHLGRAGDAVLEEDRHLCDPVPLERCQVHHLDLERIAVGNHAVEADVLQELPGEASVAGGAIVNVQAEKRSAVHVGAPAQELAMGAPGAGHRATRHVTGAQAEPA